MPPEFGQGAGIAGTVEGQALSGATLGRNDEPFRFWLAEQETKRTADPVWKLKRPQAEVARMLQEQPGVDLGILSGWYAEISLLACQGNLT